MPRRRLTEHEKRAAILTQQQADRRYQQAILEREVDTPTPTTSEAPDEDDAFDMARWDLNAKAAGLMRSRFGSDWYNSPRLQRLAERVMRDLQGHGDGKALRNLRTSHSGSTYNQACDFKFN